MVSRLSSLVVVVVVGGAIVAGCGSSSSSSSTSTPSAPASVATSTSGSASTGSGGASSSSNPGVAEAVAVCKATIGASTTLSADLKTKLQAICDKAASGDQTGVKQATAQVCQEIVKASVPQSEQAAALAACPKG
jgi:hypothetical protein